MLELAGIQRERPLPFDRCLFASGFEERARYIAASGHAGNAAVTVWGFEEHRSAEDRPANDAYFESLASAVIPLSGNDDDAAEDAAAAFFDVVDNDEPHFLVDVSSMTRCWYGALIRTLVQWDQHERLHVTFAYTPGEYSSPPERRPLNEIVGPVRGFTGFALPDSPPALLLGLGYEPGRAMGAVAEIDPTHTVCFYADPGADPRFVADVMRANGDLAQHIPVWMWDNYPLSDPFLTFHLLDAACNALGREGQVVLTNNGPKLFGVLCFLVATRYPESSVWRISSGGSAPPTNCKAAGAPYMMTTTWTRVEAPVSRLWDGDTQAGRGVLT